MDVNEQFGNEAVGLGGKYTSQEGLELGREEEMEGERKKEVEGGDGGREKEGGGRRDGEIKVLRKVLVVLEGRVCGGRGRG